MPYRLHALLMTCAVLLAALPAQAQNYPARPIRIIVAYTPAGTTDILARAIGQKMSESWGQPVIVENRPGAAGNIGTELAAKATPDGYTLIMGTAGTHGINVSLYKKRFVSKNRGRVLVRVICQVHDRARFLSCQTFGSRRLFSW